MSTRKNRPSDFAQRAKMIVDIATASIARRAAPHAAAGLERA